MSEIVVGRGSDGRVSEGVLEQLFRFRHHVFKEKLGWAVSSRRGQERDQFDDLDPVYAACCERDRVLGSWRLLPTTGPYMLRDVFPQLLRGEELPCATDVWEISRFAVDTGSSRDRMQVVCSRVTADMIGAMADFAVANGIRELVTVTSVAVERMLRASGVPLVRFGDGRATRVGNVLSVACRLDVNETVARPRFASVVGAGEYREAVA